MAQRSTKTPFGGPPRGPQGPVQMSTPSESILQWTVALLTNFQAFLQRSLQIWKIWQFSTIFFSRGTVKPPPWGPDEIFGVFSVRTVPRWCFQVFPWVCRKFFLYILNKRTLNLLTLKAYSLSGYFWPPPRGPGEILRLCICFYHVVGGVLSVFIENQVPGSPKSPVIWC